MFIEKRMFGIRASRARPRSCPPAGRARTGPRTCRSCSSTTRPRSRRTASRRRSRGCRRCPRLPREAGSNDVDATSPSGARRVVRPAEAGHRPALAGAAALEHRVVAAVRVDRRVDEDVEVVDVRRRRRVGAVVLQQAVRRLEGDQRADPLTGVLLRIDEEPGLRAVADLADPQDVLLVRHPRDLVARIDARVAGPRRPQEVAQVHDGGRLHDAGARVAAVRSGPEDRGRGRVGVQRRHDLRSRARQGPGAVRGEADRDRQAADAHRERRARRTRVDELHRHLVAVLRRVAGVLTELPRVQDDRGVLHRGARAGGRRREAGRRRAGRARKAGVAAARRRRCSPSRPSRSGGSRSS